MCLLISAVLIIVDVYSTRLANLRNIISVSTGVVQVAVDWPINTLGLGIESVIAHQQILDSNAKLQNEIIFLKSKIQEMQIVQNENLQLRALLQSSKMLTNTNILVAQLMAISSQSYNNQYTINKGTEHGVYNGQVVLDSQGVFGQVVKANFGSSNVILVTDSQSAIPVQNARTNYRGIARGNGTNGTLALINTPINCDIVAGDLFFTSGLGEKYPYGHPVGIVSNIKKNTGNGFSIVELFPSARLHSSNLLLLLEPKLKEIG